MGVMAVVYEAQLANAGWVSRTFFYVLGRAHAVLGVPVCMLTDYDWAEVHPSTLERETRVVAHGDAVALVG